MKGSIKNKPEHFIVREVPLYSVSGEGDHYYYELTKVNMNTDQALRYLAKKYDIPQREIGHAGRKDKIAVTTQMISLPIQIDSMKSDELELCYVGNHNNKLRTGHLKGNEFEIKVKVPELNQIQDFHKIKESILEFGFPNYFGDQRFSKSNFQIGMRIFNGEKVKYSKPKRLFYLSAFQSFVFNTWLEKRILSDSLINPVDGDLSLLNGEVVSGPIFGTKMKSPTSKALEIEDGLKNQFNITNEKLEKNKLKGNRRAARVLLKDLDITAWEEGVCFKFYLPKGSYATSLLREFIDIE